MNLNKWKLKYDIDFRQTKYKLPAIMYIPIFIVGCLLINIFYSPDDGSSSSAANRNDYLDGRVPEASVDSVLGTKEVNDDYGGVPSITGDDGDLQTIHGDSTTRDASGFQQEQQSSADLDEIRARQEAERAQVENYRQMQRRVRSNRSSSSSSDDDYVSPVSDSEIAQAQQRRREQIMRDLDNDIYGSRNRQIAQQYGGGSTYDPSTGQYNGYNGNQQPLYYDDYGNPVYAHNGGYNQNGYGQNGMVANGQSGVNSQEPVSEAHKIKKSSDYFNTINQNSNESGLIQAIIDENIKAIEGSRVRLKLLDDIDIDGHIIKKGTRLYITMSGFGSQRVKGNVQSILVGDKILKVNLAIYDMDGLEGLYVPQSSFREVKRDLGSSLTQGSTDFNTLSTTSNNTLKNWAGQAIQNTSQRAMDAIRKRVEKNVVHLKFGTRVYLINSSNIVETGQNR